MWPQNNVYKENGFTGSESEWLASLKGLVGDVGSQGPVGDVGGKGPSGSSVYAGYDGYIWNGSTKTDFKLDETPLADNVFEDTMSIAGVMSNYVDILNKNNIYIRNFSEATKISNENRAYSKNEFFFCSDASHWYSSFKWFCWFCI